MTHTDYIIIVLGASLLLGIGVCVAIREVHHYATPVQNVLTRRGDIELGDFINPTQAQPDINYPDLLASPLPLPVRNSSNFEIVVSNWSGHVPSYHTGSRTIPSYITGTPPRYQSVYSGHINSCLENNNLDFIWIMLLVFIWIMVLVMILFNKPINNFRISSKNISTQEIPYTKNISTQEISYTKIYQQGHKGKYFTYGKHYSYVLFYGWTIFDIKNWISTFDDIDYAVTVELIGESYPDFNNNEPRLILSWQFIVNKGSCPVLISTHIKTQSDKLIDLFDLEFDNNYSQYQGKPCILLSFTELYCSK